MEETVTKPEQSNCQLVSIKGVRVGDVPIGGHLAMSGNILGSHDLWDVIDIWWVKARDAVKQIHTMKYYPAQNVNSVKTEKPYTRESNVKTEGCWKSGLCM